jgi:hypothetical protein
MGDRPRERDEDATVLARIGREPRINECRSLDAFARFLSAGDLDNCPIINDN